MSSEKQKDVLRKIKNLLAKAESTDSIHEAETFTMNANRLLVEYNLSIEDIEFKEDSAITDFHLNNKTVRPHTEGKWVIHLYCIISKFNFCMALTLNNGHSGMRILGEKHNVEIVEYITSQLITKIRKLARDQWKLYKQMNGKEKEGAFLRGFLLYAVIGLRDKLQEQADLQMKEHTQMSGIILLHTAAINKFLEDDGTKVRDGGKNRMLKSNHGSEIGYKKGKELEINKGLTGEALTSTLRIN